MSRQENDVKQVARQWAEAFALELWLRGFSRAQIRQRLAVVEARCAQSGRSAEELFADPIAHARACGPPTGPGLVGAWGRLVARAAQLLGIVVLVAGAGGLDDGAFHLRGRDLVWFLGLVGLVVLVGVHGDRWLRRLLARPLAFAVAAVGLALVVSVVMLVPSASDVLVTVPAWTALVVGGVLLLGGGLPDRNEHARPLDPSGVSERAHSWWRSPLTLPATAVLLAGVVWVA